MGQKHSITEHDRRRLYRRLPSAETEFLTHIWKRNCNSDGTAIDTERFAHYLTERSVPQVWLDRIVSLAERIVNDDPAHAFPNFLSLGATFISDDSQCLTTLFQTLLIEEPVSKSGKRKNTCKELTKDNLTKLLLEFMDLYVAVSKNSTVYQRWHFAEVYSTSALAQWLVKDIENDVNLQYKCLNNWIAKNPLIRMMLNAVFRYIFKMPATRERVSILPSVFGTTRLNGGDPLCSNVILDSLSLAFITLQLPIDLRGEFRLLYSNSVHGQTFTDFVSKITNAGPVLIIVRDDTSSVFGGFSRVHWISKPYFYGSNDCFLFSLHPKVNVYRSGNVNANFMFLDTNENSTYNGLGMGGQLGHFGLFINGEYTYGYGSSNPCKTFDSPQLSSSHHFRINQIEVWSVSKTDNLPINSDSAVDEELEKKKSVLDKDPSALTLLSMAGRGPYSEGFRPNSSSQPNISFSETCQEFSSIRRNSKSNNSIEWQIVH